MAKNISLKNKYNDVLYWATSKQAKGKDYQITRTEEAVLRKLIHYDNSNPKITYSNSIIAEHTFMGEESVKKAIPKLVKKRYISTATYKITDDGAIKTRRTIFVKWNFIETVLDDIPKSEEKMEDIASNEDAKDDSEDFQIEREQEEITFGEETSTAPEVEVISEVKKIEIITEKVIPTDDKTKIQTFYEKCLADGRAEKKAKEDAENNGIITFEEFAKDYTIDEKISEILTPIYDLKPFMVNGKLKVNFNGEEQYISLNSDDDEIKLPATENAYYPELFDIPRSVYFLEYEEDRKPNKYLEEQLNDIDNEADPNGSSTIDNEADNEGDDLPW